MNENEAIEEILKHTWRKLLKQQYHMSSKCVRVRACVWFWKRNPSEKCVTLKFVYRTCKAKIKRIIHTMWAFNAQNRMVFDGCTDRLGKISHHSQTKSIRQSQQMIINGGKKSHYKLHCLLLFSFSFSLARSRARSLCFSPSHLFFAWFRLTLKSESASQWNTLYNRDFDEHLEQPIRRWSLARSQCIH